MTFNVSGIGEFSAVMQLYKTEEYKEAYLSPPHINITDMLYVGINLLEIENNSTFMVSKTRKSTTQHAHFFFAPSLFIDLLPLLTD